MSQPRILIVDDERLVRFALSERCELEGYETLQAKNGSEGLTALEEGVDLVLLDSCLPDTHGAEVLRRIKTHDKQIPVIMMTAFASLEAGIDAIKQGAFHYLCKPFDLEEMVTAIHRAL